MAETTTDPRVFSEDEAYAIAADRVARETAELTSKIETLETEKAELATRLDVEIAAKEAAEQRAVAAEKAHEDFLAELEAEKAQEARKEERLAKVREAASHLTDEFFADESRVTRIVAMDDEVFEGYVSDLRDAAAHAPKDGGIPRETAMDGDSVTPKGADSAAAAKNFLTRNYIAPKEG